MKAGRYAYHWTYLGRRVIVQMDIPTPNPIQSIRTYLPLFGSIDVMVDPSTELPEPTGEEVQTTCSNQPITSEE